MRPDDGSSQRVSRYGIRLWPQPLTRTLDPAIRWLIVLWHSEPVVAGSALRCLNRRYSINMFRLALALCLYCAALPAQTAIHTWELRKIELRSSGKYAN